MTDAVRPSNLGLRLATASYSMNKGTESENSNTPLSMIDNSLKDAPFDERNADRITFVSMTILYFFIMVLYSIPRKASRLD